MTTYPQKISFGELRESGVHDVLAGIIVHSPHRDQRRPLGDHVSATTTATASISATIAMKASASVSDISHMTAVAPCALARQRSVHPSTNQAIHEADGIGVEHRFRVWYWELFTPAAGPIGHQSSAQRTRVAISQPSRAVPTSY